MIKEDKSLVRINLRTQKYYKELGYVFKKVPIGESVEVIVNTSDLPKSSHVKVIAICEICGSENNISYSKYLINKNRNNKNYYSCFKCKTHVMKDTCMKLYGVDSYSKTNIFKEFISNKLNYIDIHEKCKITNYIKYGCKFYFQIDHIKTKNSGWMKSEEFRNKSKITMLYKYGVEYYSQTDMFKSNITNNKDSIVSKIKQTFIDNYNIDWISKTKTWKIKYQDKYHTIRNKVKETCMEKYGVDNVAKVDSIMESIMNTKIFNNNVIYESLLTEWEIYKRDVRKLTRRNKAKLFENWNGYDYYDNEYIKDNFEYSYTNRLYPTIDHKVSTFNGFINDIDVEDICDLSNLCITKRYINSSKSKLTEKEFNHLIENR